MVLKHYSISPLSTNADGSASFKSGTTNLLFQIGESPNEWIEANSVKLTFKLALKDDNGVVDDDTSGYISNEGGVATLFSTCEAYSLSQNVLLEQSRASNRLNSQLNNSCLADENDIINGFSHQACAITSDFSATNNAVYGATSVDDANRIAYTCRALLGLFNSVKSGIFLANPRNNGYGGIKLNFVIQNSANSIVNINGTNLYAELTDIKLLYTTYQSDDQMEIASGLRRDMWYSDYSDYVRKMEDRNAPVSELQSNYERAVVSASNGARPPQKFVSFFNYIQNVNSANNSVSINLGLNSVQSVNWNFVKSSDINSLDPNEDGNKMSFVENTTPSLVPFRDIQINKSGRPYPNKYPLQTNQSTSFTTNAQLVSNETNAMIVKAALGGCINYNNNKYQQFKIGNSLGNEQTYPLSTSKIGGVGAIYSSDEMSCINGTSDYSFSTLGLQMNQENLGSYENQTCFIAVKAENEVSWNNGSLVVSN